MSTTAQIAAHLRAETTTRLKKLRRIYSPTTPTHGLIEQELKRRKDSKE